MENKEKITVGWCEYVDLPDWGIKKLKAKIDSGAKSSCLHVEDVKEIPGNKLSFYVVLDKKKKRKKIIASPEKKGRVKSSIGIKTHRWYVETKIRIANVEKPVKINLVGRDEMNFRMLIGRTALENDFLIDTAHRYLVHKESPKTKTDKATRKSKRGKL